MRQVNEDIKQRWLELQARLKERGLRQETVAAEADVSQATVSRVLQRCPTRHGGAFRKLCIYADSLPPMNGRIAAPPVRDAELLAALGEVWDGTPEHARALAAMIRAAGHAARISKV